MAFDKITLERRLQRMEQMLLQIAERLDMFPEETRQFGPSAPFVDELARGINRVANNADHAMLKNIQTRGVLTTYKSERTAYDNHLHRKVDAASEAMAALEERLDYVELAAFPKIAATLSKTLGEKESPHDPRSAELDRCKFNPHRSRKG